MHAHQRIVLLIAIGTLLGTPGGCASTRSTGPYATPSSTTRSPLRAERLTQEAVAIMDVDPERAEELLCEALAQDLFYAPAHNNLGVLRLQRGDLYEAAHEFEWARKLMPGHADPRINLALALEQAGRVDEAEHSYRAALEVSPKSIAAIQGLTRLQLRRGVADAMTRVRLSEIALRGEDDAWRDWARMQLTRDHHSDESP